MYLWQTNSCLNPDSAENMSQTSQLSLLSEGVCKVMLYRQKKEELWSSNKNTLLRCLTVMLKDSLTERLSLPIIVRYCSSKSTSQITLLCLILLKHKRSLEKLYIIYIYWADLGQVLWQLGGMESTDHIFHKINISGEFHY